MELVFFQLGQARMQIALIDNDQALWVNGTVCPEVFGTDEIFGRHLYTILRKIVHLWYFPPLASKDQKYV